MDDMTDPSLSTTITDVQRDRAVEYQQRVYASGALSEELFGQRLGMALTAQTRAELNASLHGLARVAGMFPAPPAAKHPVHDGCRTWWRDSSIWRPCRRCSWFPPSDGP